MAIKMLKIVGLLLLFPLTSYSATEYYSQTATGGGTSCTAALGIASFNDGVTSGNTAVICNDGGSIITTRLTLDTNHSNITLQNESGAAITLRGIDLDNSDNVTIRKNPSGGSLTVNVSSGFILNSQNADNLTIDGVSLIASGNGSLVQYRPVTFIANDDLTIINSYFNYDTDPNGTCTASGVPLSCCTGVDVGTCGNYKHDIIQLSDCNRVNFGYNVVANVTHAAFDTSITPNNYVWVHHNLWTNRWRHAVGIDGNGDENILIEHNFFDQVGRDTLLNPAVVERNRAVACIEIGGPQKVIARFNTYDRPSTAINIFDLTNWVSVDRFIYHETIYNPKTYGTTATSNAGAAFSGNSTDLLNHFYYKNNIIYGSESVWDITHPNSTGASITNMLFDSNLICGFDFTASIRIANSTYSGISNFNASEWGDRNIIGNPAFINASTGNFNINNSSVCKDGGTFLAFISAKSGNLLTLVGNHQAYQFTTDWGISGKSDDTIYESDNGTSTTVTAINAHNQITVLSSNGFDVGDGITVVNFKGIKPDIGAFEAPSTINAAPSAVIDTPVGAITTTEEGNLINFTASDSDSDGTVVSRLWNFGDPNIPTQTVQDPGNVQFNTAGDYTISYFVTDNDNATSNVVTKQIRVVTAGGGEDCSQGSNSTVDLCADDAVGSAIANDTYYRFTFVAQENSDIWGIVMKFKTYSNTSDRFIDIRIGETSDLSVTYLAKATVNLTGTSFIEYQIPWVDSADAPVCLSLVSGNTYHIIFTKGTGMDTYTMYWKGTGTGTCTEEVSYTGTSWASTPTGNSRDFYYKLIKSAGSPAQASITGIFPFISNGTYGLGETITVAIIMDVAEPWTSGGYLRTDAVGGPFDLLHIQPASGISSNVHYYSAAITAGLSATDLNISTFDPGTFDVSSTLPTSENLADNGDINISTSMSITLDSMVACDSNGDAITKDTLYFQKQNPRLKLCFSEAAIFADGSLNDFAISVPPDSGGPLIYSYQEQPTGYGSEYECWVFTAEVSPTQIESTNLSLSSVQDFNRDYNGDGNLTRITNVNNVQVTSYSLPQLLIDPTYIQTVFGPGCLCIDSAAPGSLTVDNTGSGSMSVGN